MERGQRVQIKIEDMTAEGQGLGRSNGLAVFVKGAVTGDLVEAELTKVKKNYAFGRLVQVLEPSADRIEPFCPYFGQCGGCTYGGLSYEAQLAVKEKQVRDKLIRLGGVQLGKFGRDERSGIDGKLGRDERSRIDGKLGRDETSELAEAAAPCLDPIIGMEEPFRYRNKAVMPVWAGGIITRKDGLVENLNETAIGFYRAKSHEVVNCYDCFLQSPPAMAAAEALRQFIISDHITVFDPQWGKGLIRHLAVKTARSTGEVMVILVINGKGIPNAEKLVEMLDDAIYNLPPTEDGVEYSLESVVINVNKAEVKAGKGGRHGGGKADKGQSPGKNGKNRKVPGAGSKGDRREAQKGRLIETAALKDRSTLDVKPVQSGNDRANTDRGQRSASIFGQECITLAGKPTILEKVGGLQFEISPLSFYQVNPMQMGALYDKAIEYADLSGHETVLDVYCGVGTIGLFAAWEMERKQQERAALREKEQNQQPPAASKRKDDCEVIRLDGEEIVDLDSGENLDKKIDSSDPVENRKMTMNAGRVIGIESVKEAVLDANRNAVINGIVNARYVCGKAEEVLPLMVGRCAKNDLPDDESKAGCEGLAGCGGLAGSGSETGCENSVDGVAASASAKPAVKIDDSLKIDHADVVFLDPPRAGCDERLLEAVVSAAPKRIVYVSCDPATLARDVKYLAGNGYAFVKGTLVDMFPWTGSVETVALLSRKM